MSLSFSFAFSRDVLISLRAVWNLREEVGGFGTYRIIPGYLACIDWTDLKDYSLLTPLVIEGHSIEAKVPSLCVIQMVAIHFVVLLKHLLDLLDSFVHRGP